jgi:hypothetical protein
MKYFLITFDDLSKPEIQQLMFQLAGCPNGTILDRGQHIRAAGLPKNQWLMSFDRDISDFTLDGILSIKEVDSVFVHQMQQISG